MKIETKKFGLNCLRNIPFGYQFDKLANIFISERNYGVR